MQRRSTGSSLEAILVGVMDTGVRLGADVAPEEPAVFGLVFSPGDFGEREEG